MIELISKIILMGSIFGMGLILFQKIPVLVKLPSEIQKDEQPLFSVLINKIKFHRSIKDISLENVLQKILFRIRILILKMENKISFWLQKLRKKSQKKKAIKDDNYWQELRDSTNHEDKDLPA